MKKKIIMLCGLMALTFSITACGQTAEPAPAPSTEAPLEGSTQESTEQTTEEQVSTDSTESTGEESSESTQQKDSEEKSFVAVIDYIDDSGITFHPKDEKSELYDIAQSFYIPASAVSVIRENGNMTVYDVIYFYDGIEIRYTKAPSKGTTGIFSEATVVLSEKNKVIAEVENTEASELDETPIIVENNNNLKADVKFEYSMCTFSIPGKYSDSIALTEANSNSGYQIIFNYNGNKYVDELNGSQLVLIEKMPEKRNNAQEENIIQKKNNYVYYFSYPECPSGNADAAAYFKEIQDSLKAKLQETLEMYE